MLDLKKLAGAGKTLAEIGASEKISLDISLIVFRLK